MQQTRVTVDLYGEYEKDSQRLTGIWVSFPGYRRTPSLWRDIAGLVQLLDDHGMSDPEFTCAQLTFLQPGQHLVYEEVVEYGALNALGNPFEWEL